MSLDLRLHKYQRAIHVQRQQLKNQWNFRLILTAQTKVKVSHNPRTRIYQKLRLLIWPHLKDSGWIYNILHSGKDHPPLSLVLHTPMQCEYEERVALHLIS